MNQTKETEYALDFRDGRYCTRIKYVSPGHEINVLVTPENNPEADPIKAKGQRSEDGHSFTVYVDTNSGIQSNTWTWELLVAAIKSHRGEKIDLKVPAHSR